MNITDLIVELLKKGQKVELPGIGTFDSVVQSPHHDPVSRVYYPATRNIVFHGVTTGDRSLERIIAERECVDENVAGQMLHNYIEALVDKIGRTGDHRFGEIGVLSKSVGGYAFAMAEGVVIEAGNGSETPLHEVVTYEHDDSDDPFAQFEPEPEPAPQPAPQPQSEPEPEPEPKPEPEPEPEAPVTPEIPAEPTEPAESPAEAPAPKNEWEETLKKLEELPKSKAMLKAEAKAEKKRLKAEAKAEKERVRLRKLGEDEQAQTDRLKQQLQEAEAKREAEEKRRADEEIRRAEEQAEALRLKVEREEAARKRRAEEMAMEAHDKASRRAAALAAVAATQMSDLDSVAGESVAVSSQEAVNAGRDMSRELKKKAKAEKAAAKAAAKEEARLRKEEEKRSREEEKHRREEEKHMIQEEIAAATPFTDEKKSRDDDDEGRSRKWLLWLLIALVVLAVCAAAFYLLRNRGGRGEGAVRARSEAKHLDVPKYNAFTFNPDMIEYNAREIARSRDIVCANMTDYIVAFLAGENYRNARVPLMDRVQQYAGERLNQLMGDRFAVQRFIPYNDYIYQSCEPWLKHDYALQSRRKVQGELMNISVLEEMLHQLVDELGLTPGQGTFTPAEVQQVKATERAAVAPKKDKAKKKEETPLFVYVEKNSKQGFDIVAGFYLNKQTAANLAARLHDQGCDAYIIEKDEMYYVSMGSAPTRTKAEALYNHIKSWYDGDIVIKEL